MRIILLAGLLPAISAVASAQGAAAAPEKVTIDLAVREALDRNLNLLAERYNLSIADAHIATARLRPNPTVTAGADYLDLLGTGFSAYNAAGPSEYNLRTDFILERGGKRERRVKVAQDAKEAARYQLLNSTRTLVLDVQTAFVDVLQAEDSLQLARDNLKAFQSIVDVNRTRVEAGDLARVELVRTQVAALQFQNAVRQAEARSRQASYKLQRLMGRTAPSPAFQASGEMRRESVPVSLDEVRAEAFASRPDLLALRADQARSQAELRLQLAMGKVDYDIGAMYHRQFYNGHSNSLGFYFSAPLPIFNRNQGEIERARREAEQIAVKIKAVQTDIAAEVDNAWVQYSTSRGILESAERDLLGQSRDVRDTTEYSYRRGEASLVEFLDAQRAFNDARQSYNDARADYARSLYTIDSIAGKEMK